MRAGLILLLIPLFCQQSTDSVQVAVARVNTYRQAAGLESVTVDAALSNGCAAHADYLARNFPWPTAFVTGDEDPKYPGFSEEGRRAAKGAMIAVVPGDFPEYMDRWIASLSHRARLLDPNLKRMGFGKVREKGGRNILVVNATLGVATLEQPMLYPVENQKDVPLAFAGPELPDPIPESKDKKAGYPITVSFSTGVGVKQVAFTLKDAAGKDVPAWVSTPEKPTVPGHGGNSICLIARTPLRPGVTYTANVQALLDGKAWTKNWSFTTLSGSAARDSNLEARFLERLNDYRKTAGLRPVTLNAALNKGCAAHAEYLVKNAGNPATQGAGRKTEDPKLPGFSDEGLKAAADAFVVTIDDTPASALDRWMATVFFRAQVLDPALERVGVGVAHGEKGQLFVLGRDRSKAAGLPIAIYPADKQKEVLPAYASGEIPDPIPESKDKKAGLPITVIFPSGTAVKNVTATLRDGTGRDLPVWLGTPDKPLAANMQGTMICLIAKAPLNAKTDHTVTVQAQVSGRPWAKTWRFTTRDEQSTVAENMEPRVLARLNGYRKIAQLDPVAIDPLLCRACVAHAEFLVKNADHPSTKGLGVHHEDPKLPGYTKEGERAGKASVIAEGSGPEVAVDHWMATYYHRLPLLQADTRRIGFGHVRGGRLGSQSVLDPSGKGRDTPLVFPGDGQQEVPLAYHASEKPDPIPDSKDKKAGFPITITFPVGRSVEDLAVTLTDAAGGQRAVWLVTHDKPVPEILKRMNTAAAIPREPLEPNKTYTVTVKAQVGDQSWTQTWSFTTRGK